MAALTWREMSAPDLGSSIRGIGQFDEIFQRTLQNVKGTVGEIDAGITDRNNTAALRVAAAAQNSDEAKALLASQAVMGNTRLTAPTISALASRPGQLIQQALGETNLDSSKLALDTARYTDGRMRSDNAMRDGAAPAIAALAAAAATGDPAKIAAAEAQYGSAARAVPYADILGNAKGVQGMESGAVGIAADRLGMVRTGVGIEGDRIENNNKRISGQTAEFQLQTARETYNDGKIVDGLLGTLGVSAMDADTARAAVQGLRGQLTPSQLGQAMGKINSLFPGTFGTSEIPSLGGNGVGGDTTGMTYGGGQLPQNIKTVGDLVKNKGNLVKSLGASPVGMYQINADTWADFGPKALGSGWAGADVRDPQVQDAVAKKVWESVGGNGSRLWNKAAGTGRWASLKDMSQEEINRLAKMPWEQARDIISQGETRSRASQVLNSRASAGRDTARAGIQMAARNSQLQAGGPSSNKIAQSYNDTESDTEDIVAKLYAGRFKGTDRGVLERKVNEVVRDARVSPATAGAMLEASITRQKPKVLGFETLGRWARQAAGGTPDLGNGIRIDDDKLIELKSAAGRGDFERKVDAGQTIQAMNQNVQSAQMVAERASSRLQQGINRGLPASQIRQLTAQAEAAEGRLRALQQRIDQFVSPRRN